MSLPSPRTRYAPPSALLFIGLWFAARVSFGQAVDPTPFLIAPEPIKEVLAKLDGKKLVIEGTRILMHDRPGIAVQEVKQEFRVRYEIVYFSGLGLAITITYTPGSGDVAKQKILVLKLGTLVTSHSMKSVWLMKSDGHTLKEGFFWLPAQVVEQWGLTAALSKSDTATLKATEKGKEKELKMTVKRDGTNLTSVILEDGERMIVSMRCKFEGPASLPVHGAETARLVRERAMAVVRFRGDCPLGGGA